MVGTAMTRALELVTLPLRTIVLLFLFWAAYYLGNSNPQLDWRKESPESGVIAKYSRNNRPWRVFHDRNSDKVWDMWIDERGGAPVLVSVDDNGDGRPDRDQDEFGKPVDAWEASKRRARKTLDDFYHNPRQIQFTGFALMLYVLLEFAIRSTTAKKNV
jgi:hypothetical protein